MRFRLGRIAGAWLGVLALTLITAGHANAGFLTGLDGGANEDQPWFDTTVELGADFVRLDVYWASVATATPADPANPADPAYDFTAYDNFVTQAAARGLPILITFLSAPEYAQEGTPPASAHPGTWKPDPAALGAFAKAVATRYAGDFAGLPRVRYFEAWNEANLDGFFAPQYEGQKLVAVDRYRRLVNSVAQSIDSVHRDNQVVVGSLAPYGDEPGGSRTRPLVFLRKLLCLNERLKATGCPTKTRVDVMSHHPINQSGGPRRRALDDDDASSADLGKIHEVLRAAERAGTIAGERKRHELWVTEFWWNSNPPDPRFPPPSTQARWVQESLYLFWKAGAKRAIYFALTDTDNVSSGLGGIGLQFSDGRPKPSSTAFRFPFVAERRSERMLRLWGRAPVAGKLTIERRSGGGWRRVGGETVRAGEVFTRELAGRGAVKLRASVGAEASLVWAQRN